jgi:hypothetical protein
VASGGGVVAALADASQGLSVRKESDALIADYVVCMAKKFT